MIQREAINRRASEDLLRALYARGVREVVVCAGARNSPLVVALQDAIGIAVHSFFEERSAAFFALGRTRRDGRPCAVVTTSGTAAAELLPAVIEAFHTGVPLIAVTADRPRRLRGTGAPQAIDQTGLFGKFVEVELDIEAGESIDLERWKAKAPLHVNLCFDEPLLDAPSRQLDLSETEPASTGDAELEPAEHHLSRLRAFFDRVKKPVAVVGTLDSKVERDAVEELLASLRLPVYLEATSGLRESPRLASQTLRSGDKILSWALSRGAIDGVLRLGGVPTVRVWRDLDEPSCAAEVLSLGRLPFAGLSRGELIQTDVSAFCRAWTSDPKNTFDFVSSTFPVLTKDREASAVLEDALLREPQSEPALVRSLSKLIARDALVYVGNSLPIREWDLAASQEIPRLVQANRGVNGIDGQLSTFAGLLPPGREGWAIVGDLTALYDLTAPWAMARALGSKSRVVIINNGGGRIFSRIFKSPLFENRHSLGFESWAAMWNLGYSMWTEVPAEGPSGDCEVIELRPDDGASGRFWDTYDGYWSRK